MCNFWPQVPIFFLNKRLGSASIHFWFFSIIYEFLKILSLTLLGNLWGNSYTMLFVLDFMYYFTYDESNHTKALKYYFKFWNKVLKCYFNFMSTIVSFLFYQLLVHSQGTYLLLFLIPFIEDENIFIDSFTLLKIFENSKHRRI